MIEQKIDNLIAAIDRLTAALERLPDPAEALSEGPQTQEERKLEELVTTLQERAAAPEKPKKARKPAAEAPAPTPEPAPEPTPEPATEPAPEAKPEPTLNDLRAAAQKALDAGKLDGVVAINKKYGLKRISDAAGDQYAAILAELEALTNG
jgi:chromatin segregation and condensation protein Rec8/ScpA/Scc1 (kleisin family)